jgi:hypothetical protein
MTSFLIGTLYSTLGLTDAEQATVNAALPTIKTLLDAIDANVSVIGLIEQLQIKNQPLLNKILADWAVIGPNLSAAMVDGSVDLFGTLGAYNDIKSSIAAKPKTVTAATAIYTQLSPLINQAIADWPTISPAVQVIIAAAQRSNMSLDDVMTKLNDSDMRDGG